MTMDIEELVYQVKAILVANLNTQIAAVEAEKIAMGRPSTNLQAIDTTAGYYEQSWANEILNLGQAIFFGVEVVKATGLGPGTAEQVTLFVEIVLVDGGTDNLAIKRIHRYTRAIKQTLEQNWDKLPSSSKLKIETIRPISFKLEENSSETMKVGGVSITTSIA